MRLRRYGDVIVDGNVTGEITVFNFADGNGVAVLNNGRILFDTMDPLLDVAAAEQPGSAVVGMDLGRNINRTVAALVDVDIARARHHSQFNGSVDLECALKMAGGGRAERKRSQAENCRQGDQSLG